MDILSSMGNAMLNWAGNLLGVGYTGWSACSSLAYSFLKQDPRNAYGGGWTVVTGDIYSLMETLASSLLVLYFVLGWLRESVDIRNNFTLENMFRFFVRFAIAGALVTSAASFAAGISDISVAVVAKCAETQLDASEDAGDVFATVRTAIEDDEDDGGGTLVICGLVCLLAALVGMAVMLICGINIIITVLSRVFKLLLCIPFAPVAFAGFAGGQEFSQMGIAWIRAFVGYAFEAVVIAIALKLTTSMFGDMSIMSGLAHDNTTAYYVSYALLMVVNCCLPMVACSTCIKGAETIVRKCLGLG